VVTVEVGHLVEKADHAPFGARPVVADDVENKRDPTREELFYRRIEELTNGDKSKAVVTFCHPECWGSWNAAKRLVLKGYTQVHWFPDGIEGWQDTHETAAVEPDPAWTGTDMSEAQL
jgi:PQQ-dependent catabolism-associated CXXCW motif protein